MNDLRLTDFEQPHYSHLSIVFVSPSEVFLQFRRRLSRLPLSVEDKRFLKVLEHDHKH